MKNSIAAIVAAANAVEVEDRSLSAASVAARIARLTEEQELATERIQAAANASFPDAGMVAEEITTVRILRLALFGLPNQEMTITQLRAALFEVEDQDKRIDLLAANLGRVLGIA